MSFWHNPVFINFEPKTLKSCIADLEKIKDGYSEFMQGFGLGMFSITCEFCNYSGCCGIFRINTCGHIFTNFDYQSEKLRAALIPPLTQKQFYGGFHAYEQLSMPERFKGFFSAYKEKGEVITWFEFMNSAKNEPRTPNDERENENQNYNSRANISPKFYRLLLPNVLFFLKKMRKLRANSVTILDFKYRNYKEFYEPLRGYKQQTTH